MKASEKFWNMVKDKLYCLYCQLLVFIFYIVLAFYFLKSQLWNSHNALIVRSFFHNNALIIRRFLRR